MQIKVVPELKPMLILQSRNADSKAEIKKHIGLSVQGNLKEIDETFVDEALIISELFDLNEVVAFDLLVAGRKF